MTRELKRVILVAAMLAGGAGFGCGGASPSAPSSVGPMGAREGAARIAANAPPNLLWRSNPKADSRTVPHPTISGVEPLTVTFSLCNSDDPDQILLPDGTQDPRGDSLNWQFYFGDTRPGPGPVRPDVEHFCRVEHTYAAGRYVATLVVTDKHQEDQTPDLGSLARREQKVTIEVRPLNPEPTPAPAQGGSCSITSLTQEPTPSFRASTLASWTIAWSTTGSVSGVSLITPDGALTLTGLAPNGRLENVPAGSCGNFTLVVTCGDGSTVQELERNRDCG